MRSHWELPGLSSGCAEGHFLSLVRVYGLLVLGDHMMEEPCFSKLTDPIGKMVSWGLRTILGLTLGLQIVQSLVLPYADSAGKSAVMKFAEMVPGLGQATGAAARLVFGSSVLIKNSMGAAAVIILAVITLVPVVKLAVLMVMYQGRRLFYSRYVINGSFPAYREWRRDMGCCFVLHYIPFWYLSWSLP